MTSMGLEDGKNSAQQDHAHMYGLSSSRQTEEVKWLSS